MPQEGTSQQWSDNEVFSDIKLGNSTYLDGTNGIRPGDFESRPPSPTFISKRNILITAITNFKRAKKDNRNFRVSRSSSCDAAKLREMLNNTESAQKYEVSPLAAIAKLEVMS